jgi:hypothetical protein
MLRFAIRLSRCKTLISCAVKMQKSLTFISTIFFRSVTERQASVITDFVEVENNRIEETKNIGKSFQQNTNAGSKLECLTK